MRALREASPPAALIKDVARGPAALSARIEALTSPALVDLLREILAAPNAEQAKALLNEHVLGLRAEIDAEQRVPAVLTRVCLALGFATAMMQLAFEPGSSSSVVYAVTSLSLAVTGAAVCTIMGRGADSAAKDCSSSWNSLIRAVWRSLGSDDDQMRATLGEK